MQTDDPIWWGDFSLPVGAAGRWQIGPCTLLIEHLLHELCVAIEASDDPNDDALSIQVPAEIADVVEYEGARRFALTSTAAQVTLTAQLADRAVVATPIKPVEIPAGDELTVYVGSPVWVRVDAGKPKRALLDVPLHRPADTWFGPTARLGELCYASRTHCRLRLEELPSRPHRAITSVLVTNRASTPLVLEQLNLPVPYLALYQSQNGWLWTQDVVLRRDDRELSPMDVRPGAPRHAEGATRAAEPRLEAENLMVRAFSSLFAR